MSGNAKRAKGLAVTNENFMEAMQISDGRFGNKQVIVNSHMEELVSISGVTDNNDTNNCGNCTTRWNDI